MSKSTNKYHKHIHSRFLADGNNGGDTLELYQGSEHPDNMIHLTVGHSCVYFIDVDIPVEVLTAILVDAIENGKLTNPDVLPWADEVNARLLKQMETENDINH